MLTVAPIMDAEGKPRFLVGVQVSIRGLGGWAGRLSAGCTAGPGEELGRQVAYGAARS